MKSQQFHTLPIVTVAIAKQNDCFYMSASLCDGFYSVPDGFTIYDYCHRRAGDEHTGKQRRHDYAMTSHQMEALDAALASASIIRLIIITLIRNSFH